MSDIEKLKKQLRDLTDLYEGEKERADNAQQTLGDFWRREPLVHLMWSEIILLRRLLETHYKQSPAILDLPTQRAGDRKKGDSLTWRTQLTTATLKLMSTEKDLTIDSAISGGQSPTKTLQQQVQQRQEPSGNYDVLSSQLQQAQNRIQQLESQLHSTQTQYANDIQRLQSNPQAQVTIPTIQSPTNNNNDIPPPPDGMVPPPPDDMMPPPPEQGATTPSAPSSTLSIPQPPVLPGFIGKAGSAAPAGGAGNAATTVPGTNIPMPPVLPGFQAKYSGQGSSSTTTTSSSGPAAVAAPPVDPGPQPTKPAVKPIKKMKALHWKPIITGEKSKQTPASKTSIWSTIDAAYAGAVREISVQDFEEKFTSAPPKAKVAVSDPDAEAKALREANKPQRLLDPNRHNQLSIMLSKMPALPEMKRALIALDSTVLKPEHIESLHKNMFTSEDIDTVKSSGLPKDKLMLPEQWILEMSTIPQLAARIECWRFSQIFQDDYISVVRPLARIETTCHEIKTSKTLQQFFTYILVIGNHLNGGTARGRADGFDLDSLSKLFRIKDSDGTGTLMDYIVTFMINKYGPDVTSTLRQELSTLSESKQTSLRIIAGDAKKLLGKINLTLKMQSLVMAQNIPGDQFERVLGSFALDAEAKVKALDSRATTAVKAFYDVVQYLEPHLEQGQVDKIQSEEWLPLLDEFVTGVVQIRTNQLKKIETAEREAKQQANLAALQAKGGKKPIDGGMGNPAGQELGENGFPKLRSAADRPQHQNNTNPSPADELQGGFPKLRSAADRQQQQQQPQGNNPANELAGGFPKLRSANTNENKPQQQPSSPEPGFVRPQLKKTETKVATTSSPAVQNVSAAEFDNVKRPTAKSNVFLKAQNKAPMNQEVKQQQAQQQQKQQALPPPPEQCFNDDSDNDGSDVDDAFFLSLELPPPPPDDSD